jgi:hypothetical protein
MPRVLNIWKCGRRKDAKFIGRPSKWGNKYIIGRDGTRKEVVAKHRMDFLNDPEAMAAAKRELRGFDLLCFCEPEECHGRILLEVANAPESSGSTGDETRPT